MSTGGKCAILDAQLPPTRSGEHMAVSIPVQIKTDGTSYRITPKVMEILTILFSMSLEEYTEARLFLSPWQFFYAFMRRNDLAMEAFEAMVQRDYHRWHTQMVGNEIGTSAQDTPIPPRSKVN